MDYLTGTVEEAVYRELEAISERGDVLGAMDTMCQRGKIQDKSLYCEHRKHDGSLPLMGALASCRANTPARWLPRSS